MQQLRFVAKSVEELERLARSAEPPVQLGDLAELALPQRRVRMQVQSVHPLVVWDEVPCP